MEITATAAKQLINDKKTYHEAVQRNGFVMPNIRARICTIEYFEGVRKGLIYAPRFTDLILRPCPRPPSKLQAQEALVKVLEDGIPQIESEAERLKYINLLQLLKIPGQVDLNWTLSVISTLT